WTVGGFTNATSTQPLIEHWDGVQWARVNLPQQEGFAHALGAVAALSTTNVWAAGNELWHAGLPCVSAKPNAPKQFSPLDGSSFAHARAILKWKPVKDATWYTVTVKAGKKIIDRQFDLTGTQYRTITLARGQIYSWRVQACNSIGCQASPWQAFTRE